MGYDWLHCVPANLPATWESNRSHPFAPSPPQARHTGIKICQQIAILMGCAVLPHLKSIVDIIKHGLKDENQKVRRVPFCAEVLSECPVMDAESCWDVIVCMAWRRGRVQHE